MTDSMNMRPDPTKAALVVIDIQEKLARVMEQKVMDKVARNTVIMVEAAREFDLPILVTEQYVKGLGKTVAPVQAALKDTPAMEKMEFSSCGSSEFRSELTATTARDIILCGIETHVCVLQTALDLLSEGYRVFIPADAVCSRSKTNWKLALNMMHEAGAVIGSTEIFVFQMLKVSGTESFKRLSKLIK